MDNSSKGGVWEVAENTKDKLFETNLNKYIELAKNRDYDYVSDKKRILQTYNNK